MPSAFFGINVGQQGLYTAQANLNITSHNIANAETEGYSRQYGVQSASRAMNIGERGMQGTGSEITNVLQHRDDYLDDKYWDLVNELGEFEVRDELLSQMELILNEPSDNGYSAFFNDIFESLQTLSKNPGDATSQSSFVASLNAFTTYLNDVGTQLREVQKDANFGIGTNVDQINYYSQQLATLNNQIANLELTGNVANDLRDERNRLVDELSKVINVETKTITDVNGQETFRVTLNGQILVDDTKANYLETRPRDVFDNPEDATDMYDIYWKTGNELYISQDSVAGELKGYLDIRSGNNSENFKGTLIGGEGTSTVVIENPSRTDILQAGELTISGVEMRYNSYVFDDQGDTDPTNDTITFELGAPASSNGQLGSTTDIYGESFSGTITWDSAEQVRLSNAGDQDLEDTGTINLDGTVVTYTGYSKNAGTGEITLTIETPVGSTGSEVRIGEEMDFKGVPYYIDQLNEFVRTLAMEFNAVNELGNGGTGEPLFTYEGYTGTPALDTANPETYEAITIFNFIVNENVVEDPSLVANTTNAGGGESANDLLLAMLELRHDEDMFDKGEPENFMEAMIGELGIDTKKNIKLMKGQEDMLTLVENQRLSVSGVDMNEETTNLVKYQQAYNVAAQIISVMNEIYDTTINRMGV